MLPNIVYFVKHKNDAANAYNNKTVTVLEQIGRYACFVLMISERKRVLAAARTWRLGFSFFMEEPTKLFWNSLLL